VSAGIDTPAAKDNEREAVKAEFIEVRGTWGDVGTPAIQIDIDPSNLGRNYLWTCTDVNFAALAQDVGALGIRVEKAIGVRARAGPRAVRRAARRPGGPHRPRACGAHRGHLLRQSRGAPASRRADPVTTLPADRPLLKKRDAMKLATIRTTGGTAAVRVEQDTAVELGDADVGAVLNRPGWQAWAAAASGPEHPAGSLDYAPLVPRPPKIICVGLNYRTHILESGRDLPEHPVLFPKYALSLIGARDNIALPVRESSSVDWEGELALVIGRRGRRVPEADALSCVGGYAILNDVSVRDWQKHTHQWMPGKSFEGTTPLGPWLVTTDETTDGPRMLRCDVDGELMQEADTADLVFGPAALIAYISRIISLEPGDVIATGTPGGVGAARKPPRFLSKGQTVVTTIDGLGECRNVCAADEDS
jgi:acylpyruvate hydrolase